MSRYEVSISCDFDDAESPADAALMMADWLAEGGAREGFYSVLDTETGAVFHSVAPARPISNPDTALIPLANPRTGTTGHVEAGAVRALIGFVDQRDATPSAEGGGR